MSNGRQECLLSEVSINVDRLGSLPDDVQTEVLKPVATAFASNVVAVHALLTLPHHLAMGFTLSGVAFTLLREMFQFVEPVMSKVLEHSPEPVAGKLRNFDLRNCMGYLLEPKFDPTSLPRIKRAYTAAFGKASELTGLFDAPELGMLEASRHLIVHRAGVVDEEFKKRAAKWGINYAIDVLLPLDGKQVSRLANAAIDAGCKLLSFVDEWMVNNPA
jgi:hypothetical protein